MYPHTPAMRGIGCRRCENAKYCLRSKTTNELSSAACRLRQLTCFNIMFLGLIHLRCQPFVTVYQQRFVVSFTDGTCVLLLRISRIQVSILPTNQLVQLDCCEPLRCNRSRRNFLTVCAMPFVLNITPTVPNRPMWLFRSLYPRPQSRPFGRAQPTRLSLLVITYAIFAPSLPQKSYC